MVVVLPLPQAMDLPIVRHQHATHAKNNTPIIIIFLYHHPQSRFVG